MKIEKMLRFGHLSLGMLLLTSCSLITHETTVGIKTSKSSNCGYPLSMYVKEVDKVEYLIDTYPGIVKEFFSSEKNPNFILSKVIFPGNFYKMKIPRSKADKCLGIYFLFTEMGERWKILVSPPTDKLEIILGEREVSGLKGM